MSFFKFFYYTFIVLTGAMIGEIEPVDFFLICFIPICIIILVLVITIKVSRLNNTGIIHKQEISQDMKKNQIEEFAVIYIENRIKSPDDELSFIDYKKFNNIVQVENNIKVSNDYNTEVPYCIREILYNTYLKKKRELKNNCSI